MSTYIPLKVGEEIDFFVVWVSFESLQLFLCVVSSFSPIPSWWPCWAWLFTSKDLVFMQRASGSQHTHKSSAWVHHQTNGSCVFFWFIRGALLSCSPSPPLNLSLLPPPPVLQCEGSTSTFLCVCCRHCDHVCMSANMTSVRVWGCHMTSLMTICLWSHISPLIFSCWWSMMLSFCCP